MRNQLSIPGNEVTCSMLQSVIFQDLGNMPYRDAWDYQETLLQQNLRIKADAVARHHEPEANVPTQHHFLLVEHLPVYTLGKSGKEEHILIGLEDRERLGIEYFKINRGGDITFHGPGQIVGYPIIDLEKFYTDIGRYLRDLEEVIILTLAEYGIKGERSKGETGVWIDPEIKGRERKICALGVRCSRWVTMHGFAFNVNTDLKYFDHIIPCGIKDKKVTSLKEELGRTLSMQEVKERVQRNFEHVFNVQLIKNP